MIHAERLKDMAEIYYRSYRFLSNFMGFQGINYS